MKLTPPKNITYSLAVLLGLVALVLGFMSGFAVSTYWALAGLVVLVIGNAYEKI